MINKERIISPIQLLDYSINNNKMFVKREDLISFSFGGNKARKAMYFWEEILKGKYNYVITYGSASSNHCRIISNLCKKENIRCTIITTEEDENTFNRKMCCEIFDAEIVSCGVTEVKKTIEEQIQQKEAQGYTPYFIQGGGHGNIGTRAYVDAYEDIRKYEQENQINFDAIFLASGTGTTQAGLVIGKHMKQANTKIIGISIAREQNYGRNVIIQSIKDYGKENRLDLEGIESEVIFLDKYKLNGYGEFDKNVEKVIKEVLISDGIYLDPTYTGKAFSGMKQYLKEKEVKRKKYTIYSYRWNANIF